MKNLKENQKYMRKWLKMRDKMAEEGFTWSMLEDGDDYHQYMSMYIHEFEKDKWEDIEEATEKVGHVLNRAYKEIVKRSDLWMKLGLPKETIEVARMDSQYFSYFTRLDFIEDQGTLKFIEVNSDTPTGFVEASVANRVLCEEQGKRSPNQLEEGISKAWDQIRKDYELEGSEKVYFTSYEWADEDRETVEFNRKHSGLENTAYIGLEDLIVAEDGVYDEQGNKIDVLYRLYPLEYLPEDEDEWGNRIGKMLLDHVAKGRLKLINPGSAFLMQSKAVMPLIWKLVEEGYFSQEEEKDIRKYFLPTYFTREYFVRNGLPYVEKPILGREGGGIQVVEGDGKLLDKDEDALYRNGEYVYQEYVEMPECNVETWDGSYTGRMVVGSFLIGGESRGVFLRVGEKITGAFTMFCGVSVKGGKGNDE